MTTYQVKTGNTFNNKTIRVFATYAEASAYTNQHFAETGESSWVRKEQDAPATAAKAYATPAC